MRPKKISDFVIILAIAWAVLWIFGVNVPGGQVLCGNAAGNEHSASAGAKDRCQSYWDKQK